MIINKHFEKHASDRQYDVCIIGAGVMGIVLANELKETNLQICVIESGRQDLRSLNNGQKRVVSSDLQLRELSRERGLGGSSQTWWGLTGIFDPYDLQKQSASPYSGWPIKYDVLMNTVRRAAKTYDFPDIKVYSEREQLDLPIFRDQEMLKPEVFAAKVRPLRFGKVYQSLFEDRHIDLYQGLTAQEIRPSVDGTEIKDILCLLPDREEVIVTARTFVLAAGGIENPRIMLNSKSVTEAGIGNEYDQVGRYFMNHPKGVYGEVELYDRAVFKEHFTLRKGGTRYYTGVAHTEAVRERERLLHPYIQLFPVYPWSGHYYFDRLMRLKNRVVKKEQLPAREGFSGADVSDAPRGTVAHIGNFIEGIGLFCLYYLHKAFGVYAVRRARIRNYIDMAPRPENRVTLSEECDALGAPLAKLTATLGKEEKESLIALHCTYKSALAQKGVGKLRSQLADEEDWPVTLDAAHHMGTTRMGNDPECSVVDSNCRVHTINNLYVAGTSVFPTGGNINPTLMAIGLTVRLAEHIRKLHKIEHDTLK